jgi:hypothetical protein
MANATPGFFRQQLLIVQIQSNGQVTAPLNWRESTMSNAGGIIFRGARIFDGESEQLIEGHDVVIEGATIQDVIPCSDIAHPGAEVVNCGGRVLMPA